MIPLAELRRSFAAPGRVDWIGLRPQRLVRPVPVEAAELGHDGLAGDHARPGKRALTLIQSEHLPAIAALIGTEQVMPDALRRNLVISGINLRALREGHLRIGAAVVQITVVCAPCSRMEAALGPGGYTAMRGHGGWCAEVITPGTIRLGDSVLPL